MDGQQVVEVTVDEVIRIAGDASWREFSEVAKALSEPCDPSKHETPVGAAAIMLREVDGERVLPIYVGMSEAFSIWLSITDGNRCTR